MTEAAPIGPRTPCLAARTGKYPDAPLGWALKPDGTVTLKDTGVPYPVAYSLGGRMPGSGSTTTRPSSRSPSTPTIRRWANCGIYIAKAMRDKFLLQGPNAVLPFLYFPWTLVAAYHWTHDPSYKEAVVRIADDGLATWGWLCDAEMREHALRLRAAIGAARCHRRAGLQPAILRRGQLWRTLYGNATGSPDRSFNQPFMLGSGHASADSLVPDLA